MRAHARLGAVEGCHPFISSLNINSEDSIKLALMTCGLCLHTPVMMEYFPFLARALRATRHPPQSAIDGHRSHQKTLRADIVDLGQLDCALTVACCSKFIGA
jgi:hypothetical protein